MTPPPPPIPSALLFDLDGTLVDSRRDIADAVNATLLALGRAPLSIEAILSMVGDGARELIARALGAEAPGGEALVDRALPLFLERYAESPCVHTTLLPGAEQALALDLPRALITNKPRAITLLVLDALELESSFASVYAGGDGPLKPAPDGVLRIAGELGVDVSRAWLVGDGPQDVLAGRAAGCFTIAVPGIAPRARVEQAGPDRLLGSLHDVARLAAEVMRA